MWKSMSFYKMIILIYRSDGLLLQCQFLDVYSQMKEWRDVTPCPLVVQGRWPKKQNMTNLSMHKGEEDKIRAHTSLALRNRQKYITFYVVFNPLDEYQKQQFFCLNWKLLSSAAKNPRFSFKKSQSPENNKCSVAPDPVVEIWHAKIILLFSEDSCNVCLPIREVSSTDYNIYFILLFQRWI